MLKTQKTALAAVLASLTAVTLTACGGGGDADPKNTVALNAPAAQTADVPGDVAPTFHRLPDAVGDPGSDDESGHSLSAYTAAHVVTIGADVAGLDTRELTNDKVTAARWRLQSAGVKPLAAPAKAVVYTPAQIRAAYGLPTLPTSYVGLSASAAAALGAGQTVYVVDAYDNPNALSDLATFSAKFGLPVCTAVAIDPAAALPLAPASMTGCTVSKVFTTANSSAMTAVAPAYNSGWAGEIALDIQWVHAIAPLARIVLIEAPDAGVGSLVGAVNLANKMGPGNVSMSFGAPEGSWVTAYDSTFTTPGMSYFAATGDNGAQVLWPSVSPTVLGVGGTTLTYSGTGARSEVAWASAGGGVSLYEPVKAWQLKAIPTATKRTVADVSMNANPQSGQYVYVTAPGTTTGSWYAYGGTSMSTPMWSALVSVANAQRATLAKPVLGANLSNVLYTYAGVGTTGYAANFLDIKSGSNGTCTLCKSVSGYDVPTGLGTPNSAALLTTLQSN